MAPVLLCDWPLLCVDAVLSASLAIHPDKIRIATGQIAGVDKDGRVRTEREKGLLSPARDRNRKCTEDVTNVDEKLRLRVPANRLYL